MATTSIYRAEVSSRPAARFDGDGNPVSGTGQALEIRSEARGPGWSIGIPAPRLTGAEPSRRETELRAAARRRGLTMKELGAKMGVSVGHLSGVATGRKPWTSRMRERAVSVLGEVPGQGVVYRQGGVVSGESSYIREGARALGMSMQDLAERVGVTPGYMTQVSRGYRNMSVKVQARVESALEAPAKVAPAKCAGVDRQAVWDRMNAHGISQNEVARRADLSSAYLSQIMSGKSNPSPGVLKRLHGVLFQRSKAEERIMPAEVKVLGWRKGERRGVVVRGAGGPGHKVGGGTVRIGGRVPWGAKADFAYRAGYDGRAWVSVTPVVERGYSGMLTQRESVAA